MHGSDSAVIAASVKPHERSNEPLVVSTTPSQSHVHTQQTPLYGSIGETLCFIFQLLHTGVLGTIVTELLP